jgi:hypothetical protein
VANDESVQVGMHNRFKRKSINCPPTYDVSLYESTTRRRKTIIREGNKLVVYTGVHLQLWKKIQTITKAYIIQLDAVANI